MLLRKQLLSHMQQRSTAVALAKVLINEQHMQLHAYNQPYVLFVNAGQLMAFHTAATATAAGMARGC